VNYAEIDTHGLPAARGNDVYSPCRVPRVARNPW